MTNNTKTREAHEAYVANRKEAGRVIDIETCEYTRCYANPFDPYLTDPWDDVPPDDELRCCNDKCWFVWSKESDGWIAADDLPEEKWQALQRRNERELKLWKLWEAASAAHPMYEVVTHADWFFPDEIKWKGDGEEPSRDALIEWFKVNHPTQASEAERKIKADHDDLLTWLASQQAATIEGKTSGGGGRG
jgi:hypothetical protein